MLQRFVMLGLETGPSKLPTYKSVYSTLILNCSDIQALYLSHNPVGFIRDYSVYFSFISHQYDFIRFKKDIGGGNKNAMGI